MSLRRLTTLVTLAALSAIHPAETVAARPVTRDTTATITTAARGAEPTGVPITKVITFVVENHSLRQMRTSMPFLHQLATTYAYAVGYSAVGHPSLPNYLAMASGSTRGVTDDGDPSRHPLRGATVFDQALGSGKTATIYADAMATNCQRTSVYPYAVRHNPWTYFVDGRTSCREHDVPIARFEDDVESGSLPNAGMVIPDRVHDAHDADLDTADAWIESQIRLIRTGPDWLSGHLAIVVTADEDDRTSGNKVLTVVASRYQEHRVVKTPLSHYSLTRLYESVLDVPYLGGARNASSMSDAFGMRTNQD